MPETRTFRTSQPVGPRSGYGVGSSSQFRPTLRSAIAQPAPRVPSPSARSHVPDSDRRTQRTQRSVQSFRREPSSTSNLRTTGGDIEINDGQFTAVGGSHISVTINTDSGGEMRGSRTDTTDEVHQVVSPTPSSGPWDRTSVNEPPSLPMQSSWEIYYRHIGAKARGSPLWIPAPNKTLHIDYQRSGISIGDVGIITFYGGFDFLFNICLPRDHPINPPDLPASFTSVNITSRDLGQYTAFGRESYLSSASIRKSQQEGGVPSLIFESSASEGAILAMPAGSSSAQLLNIGLFRKWITAHAEDLYRYANDTCGREARNGDIRLVTGFDKTTKWGMATFSNSNSSSSTADSSLLLKFRPLDEEGNPGSSRTYGWEYSGTAEVRAGPDVQDVEELKRGDPSEEHMEYENQCLFLRTLNVTLQEKIWKKLSLDMGETFADDGITDTSSSLNLPPGSRPSGHIFQSRSNSTSRSQTQNSRQVQNIGVGRLHSSTFPTAMPWHPSDDVNKLLLKANPDARMAIMDDTGWLSVLKESDTVVPSAKQILKRLTATFVLREKEGAVFLEEVSFSPVHALTNTVTETAPTSVNDRIFPNSSSVPLPSEDTVLASRSYDHLWKHGTNGQGSENPIGPLERRQIFVQTNVGRHSKKSGQEEGRMFTQEHKPRASAIRKTSASLYSTKDSEDKIVRLQAGRDHMFKNKFTTIPPYKYDELSYAPAIFDTTYHSDLEFYGQPSITGPPSNGPDTSLHHSTTWKTAREEESILFLKHSHHATPSFSAKDTEDRKRIDRKKINKDQDALLKAPSSSKNRSGTLYNVLSPPYEQYRSTSFFPPSNVLAPPEGERKYYS